MLREVFVFIDGAYLSIISKHFGEGKYLNLDIYKFSKNISKTLEVWCKGVYYYTAPPFQSESPTKDEARRKANYDKFVSALRKIPNFTVREGRCQKVEGDFHQKGVDTLFVMDLMDMFNQKEINLLIIVACDTDFVPILNKLRKSGFEIVLFYFSDFKRNSQFSMSNHLFTACDKKILINEDLLKRSYKD